MSRKNLGELLLEYGMITQDDIDMALEVQKSKGIRIGEALIELGKVTEYDIEYILSVQLGIPYLLVDDLTIDEKLLNKFPSDFLIENRILPIYETDKEISIVTDDPFNEEAFNKIKSFMNKDIKLSCGESSKILELLNKFLCLSEGVPLISEIENILEDMKKDNQYRIDFYMVENGVSIGLFGKNKLNIKKVLKMQIELEDIFNTFKNLKIPFYYDLFDNSFAKFISIYPVLNDIQPEYPSIIDNFGLVKINGLHFSDLKSYMIENAFYSDKIIKGYPYLSFKKEIDYELAVCVADKGD